MTPRTIYKEVMGDTPHGLNKNGSHLIVAALTLLTFITLFVSRSLDDNRLVSWQWAFAHADAGKVFFIIVLGVCSAYVLAKASFPERHPVLFLLFFSYGIAALFWGEPEVIVDASRYFTQAKHLELYGVSSFFKEWGRDIPAWTDLPLVPFLYGLVFKFFGESRPFIQTFTTALFSLTVVLTYLIGKELWDEEIGFSGGMLLLGIPYLFTQTPLMLVDAASMCFLALSAFTLIRALRQGGVGRLLLSSLAIFLAFFSKYSAWLMLSVLVVIFVAFLIPAIRHPNHGPRASAYLKRGAAVALTAAALIGVTIFSKYDVFREQIGLLQGYQRSGLRRWGESFVSTFLFQAHPFITAGALVSGYAALRKRDLRYAIALWLPLLVTITRIERIRYLIMVFPMLALAASLGLREINDRALRRFIVFCVVSSSVVVAIFVYLPFVKKISTVNLKDAGRYLDTLDMETVEVFTPTPAEPVANPAVAVPILDLHTQKKLTYRYQAESLPPPARIETSSLRFTWEYKNPAYYARDDDLRNEPGALVVISSEPDETLPAWIANKVKGRRKTAVFKTNEGVFRFRTVVTVYQPRAAHGKSVY